MSCNGLKSPGKTERPFSAEASRVLQDSTSVSGIRSNPVTPKKRNVTFFHPPSQQHFPLSSHHLSDIEPMKFYQASGGCPCVHQLPHFMGPEPVPATRDAAVGVTKMVSIETQTGRSLVFSDDPYNDSPAASEQGKRTRQVFFVFSFNWGLWSFEATLSFRGYVWVLDWNMLIANTVEPMVTTFDFRWCLTWKPDKVYLREYFSTYKHSCINGIIS